MNGECSLNDDVRRTQNRCRYSHEFLPNIPERVFLRLPFYHFIFYRFLSVFDAIVPQMYIVCSHLQTIQVCGFCCITIHASHKCTKIDIRRIATALDSILCILFCHLFDVEKFEDSRRTLLSHLLLTNIQGVTANWCDSRWMCDIQMLRQQQRALQWMEITGRQWAHYKWNVCENYYRKKLFP